VDVGVSCDGVGKVYEIIRRGAKWEKFVKNFDRLRRMPVCVRIAATPQRENLSGLADLVRWAVEQEVSVDLTNVLLYPREMSILEENPLSLLQAASGLDKAANDCLELGRPDAAKEADRLSRLLRGVAASYVRGTGGSIPKLD
jgi:hypothetical protein